MMQECSYSEYPEIPLWVSLGLYYFRVRNKLNIAYRKVNKYMLTNETAIGIWFIHTRLVVTTLGQKE